MESTSEPNEEASLSIPWKVMQDGCSCILTIPIHIMNHEKTWGRIIKIVGKMKILELEVWWWAKRRQFLDLKSCNTLSLQSLDSKPKCKPP
jgi:hypothetical protein